MRDPMVEVLRCEFSGTSIQGGRRVVTVEMAEPFGRCQVKVDGQPLSSKSWPRCRSMILRRIFAGMETIHKSQQTANV
jgi:hypothetical protein